MATESTESSSQGDTILRKRARRDNVEMLPENEEESEGEVEHQPSYPPPVSPPQQQEHTPPRKRQARAFGTRTRNRSRNGRIASAPLSTVVSTSASVPSSSSSIQASPRCPPCLHPPMRPTLPPCPVPSQHLLLTRILRNQEKILNYLENYIIPYTYKYIYAGTEDEEDETNNLSDNLNYEDPVIMTQTPQHSPLHRQSSQDHSINSPTTISPTESHPYRTIITVPPEQLHNHDIHPAAVQQQSETNHTCPIVTILQLSSESNSCCTTPPNTTPGPSESTIQGAQGSAQQNQSPQELTPDIGAELQLNESLLTSPEAVIAKYPKLRGDKKMGALAVALARECYFGKDVMRGASVSGKGPGTAPLPSDGMGELQQVILSLCPSYQNDMTAFSENIWSKCRDAINHACSSYRRKMS